MTRFQGNVGQEYDLFKLVCPHYDGMRKLVGDTIADGNYRRILEVGSGSGYTTSAILLAGKNSAVTAIDNEAVMIEQAKVSLDDYVRKGRLEFVEADALSYLQGLESESFDAFASGFTMHNFGSSYRNKVLDEIYRVIKRGGLFVNADKYARDDVEEHKRDLDLRLEMIRSVFDAIGRSELREEWVRHYLEDENHIQREEESIRRMQKIGFGDLRVAYRYEMEAMLVGVK